jgi:hypothetical protein
MVENYRFYKTLTNHEVGLAELLKSPEAFKDIPDDWHIVLVDIENSTQAVQNGLHHDVNLSATGSIVAILNEIKKKYQYLEIPYFFGGDGATFIVPDIFLDTALTVLENYRHHVKLTTSLTLKVGSLQVKDIYARNLKVRIAKLALNPYLTIPILLGTGLKYAEGVIKSSFVNSTIDNEEIEAVDLNGMECRWREIDPPVDAEKIVCLLINCPDDALQAEVYQSIIEEITNIFGNDTERQPISTFKLKLDLSVSKIKNEMYARIGKFSFVYLIKNWLITMFGKYYFKFFRKGKDYIEKISQLSHTIMIDGTINTVISGTQEEIDRLTTFLNELEKQGKIVYGIHTTHASIMSCYVEDRKTNHNHFVDGTEGGFTSAAKMYKAKMLSA